MPMTTASAMKRQSSSLAPLLLLLLAAGSVVAFMPLLPVTTHHHHARATTTPRVRWNVRLTAAGLNITMDHQKQQQQQQQQQQHEDESMSPATPHGTATKSFASTATTGAMSTQPTAIVLNLNARSVTSELGQLAKEVFGSDHVFVTSTAEQARAAAAHIIALRYSLVIPVGGDGTLSSLIQYMCQAVLQQQPQQPQQPQQHLDATVEDAMRQLPVLGYIPLGTGNGVGSVVGCRPPRTAFWRKFLPGARQRQKRQWQHLLETLRDIGKQQSSLPQMDIVELPLMEVTRQHSNDDAAQDENSSSSTSTMGDLCFFAGVGFDSLMLNDFKAIKAWSHRNRFFTATLSSVTGYCVALMIKTLPKCVTTGAHNVHVQVTTRHAETACWVDHRRGDFVRPVPLNGQLYSGKTGILAAGTSPFYGGGLRLFPFARLTTDKMHLRLGRIHPLTGFFNIPRIFAGSYRDKSDANFGCIDFMGTDFEVQVTSDHASSTISNSATEKTITKGFPFQHSGESVGHVERFRLRMVQEPARFVSLMPRSWINDGSFAEKDSAGDDDSPLEYR